MELRDINRVHGVVAQITPSGKLCISDGHLGRSFVSRYRPTAFADWQTARLRACEYDRDLCLKLEGMYLDARRRGVPAGGAAFPLSVPAEASEVECPRCRRAA